MTVLENALDIEKFRLAAFLEVDDCSIRFCNRACFCIFDAATCKVVWDSVTELGRGHWYDIYGGVDIVTCWLKCLLLGQMLLQHCNGEHLCLRPDDRSRRMLTIRLPLFFRATVV